MGDSGLKIETTPAGSGRRSRLEGWQAKTGAHDLDETGLDGRVDWGIAHPLRLNESHGLASHAWQLDPQKIELSGDSVLDDLSKFYVDQGEQSVELVQFGGVGHFMWGEFLHAADNVGPLCCRRTAITEWSA